VVFVDLKKAFDSPPRQLVWQVLERSGAPPRLLEAIKAFHFEMKAKVQGSNHSFPVERGVRQGCVLGPVLFGMIFQYLVECSGLNEGIGVTFDSVIGKDGLKDPNSTSTSTRKNCIHLVHGEFADDLFLVGTDPAKLTAALDRLATLGSSLGIEVQKQSSCGCTGMQRRMRSTPGHGVTKSLIT
jgi:hypothetical protein